MTSIPDIRNILGYGMKGMKKDSYKNYCILSAVKQVPGTPERGCGGQPPPCPFLRGTRGQECPFNGTIHFFNNVQYDDMKTMILTLQSNNHRSLNWSYPNMQKRISFTSVRIFLIVF